jgi:PHD/YefM family antitoxin component YafN of YafNO toxin-antitoxin module
MIQLTPEFLKKNGKPEFVVLPYEEFLLLEEMLSDLQDLQDLRQAKIDEQHQPTVSLADVKAMFDMA